MAEEAGGQEKTEEPTPRRLTEARRKGDVAKSIEVPSSAVLIGSLLTVYALGDFMLDRLMAMARHYFGGLHAFNNIVAADVGAIMMRAVLFSVVVVGPVMVVVVVIAYLTNVGQFGFIFTTEKLVPDFAKINPIRGFARLFSLQMLVNTLKSIAKVVIIGYVAYDEIRDAFDEINPLMNQEPYQIMAFVANVSFWIILKAALILVVLAAFDYAFQRWHYMKNLKMTKQEIREEAKQTEGDPHVKGRIRSIQMEMARRRMMAEVPKADVVITNPVHLAVALLYDRLTMKAPKVVAKGAGVIAHRIKEVAAEHGVPVVEDKPLAQALYREVDLDEGIPENLYQAVAEVLAYVYSLKRKSDSFG